MADRLSGDLSSDPQSHSSQEQHVARAWPPGKGTRQKVYGVANSSGTVLEGVTPRSTSSSRYKTAEAREKNRLAQQRFRDRQKAALDKQDEECEQLQAEGERLREANEQLAKAVKLKEKVLAVRDSMVAALEPPPQVIAQQAQQQQQLQALTFGAALDPFQLAPGLQQQQGQLLQPYLVSVPEVLTGLPTVPPLLGIQAQQGQQGLFGHSVPTPIDLMIQQAWQEQLLRERGGEAGPEVGPPPGTRPSLLGAAAQAAAAAQQRQWQGGEQRQQAQQQQEQAQQDWAPEGLATFPPFPFAAPPPSRRTQQDGSSASTGPASPAVPSAPAAGDGLLKGPGSLHAPGGPPTCQMQGDAVVMGSSFSGGEGASSGEGCGGESYNGGGVEGRCVKAGRLSDEEVEALLEEVQVIHLPEFDDPVRRQLVESFSCPEDYVQEWRVWQVEVAHRLADADASGMQGEREMKGLQDCIDHMVITFWYVSRLKPGYVERIMLEGSAPEEVGSTLWPRVAAQIKLTPRQRSRLLRQWNLCSKRVAQAEVGRQRWAAVLQQEQVNTATAAEAAASAAAAGGDMGSTAGHSRSGEGGEGEEAGGCFAAGQEQRGGAQEGMSWIQANGRGGGGGGERGMAATAKSSLAVGEAITRLAEAAQAKDLAVRDFLGKLNWVLSAEIKARINVLSIPYFPDFLAITQHLLFPPAAAEEQEGVPNGQATMQELI